MRMVITNKGFLEYDVMLALLLLLSSVAITSIAMYRISEMSIKKLEYADLQQQALCFSDQILKNYENGLISYDEKNHRAQENLLIKTSISNVPKNLCNLSIGNNNIFSKNCNNDACVSVNRLAFDSKTKQPKVVRVVFCE